MSLFSGSNTDDKSSHGSIAFQSSGVGGGVSGSENAFWEKELVWQREELSKEFSVSVSDPQQVSSVLSSYTTYLVASSLCPDGVRRRYSDFDWLRDVLVARFHGIAIPLMPEKRLVGNQSRAFIEERTQGLEQFMMLVLSNPYVRLDATLRMFLTTKGAAEFEQAKKATAGGVGSDPASNAGLARWFGVLRILPLPADSDAAITELTAAVEDMDVRIVNTLSAVTKYWEASKATAEALRHLRDSFRDWSTSSASNSDGMSHSLSGIKTHSAVLSQKLRRTGDAFSNAHDLAVFAPNEIQIFLLDGLVTEIHRLRSLKALLSVRDYALKDYSNAWIEQDKLHFQQKQFRDKMREDKAMALEPKIAEAVGNTKRFKERLDDITKGIIHIESDKNSRARTARFISMVGQFSTLAIASGVRTQEVWQNFLATMELNQNSMVLDAQATLTGKSSMHSLDTIAGANISLPVPSSVFGDMVLDTAAPVTSTLASLSISSEPVAEPVPAPVPAPAPAPAAPSFGASDDFFGSSKTTSSNFNDSGALFSGSSFNTEAENPPPVSFSTDIFGGSSVDI